MEAPRREAVAEFSAAELADELEKLRAYLAATAPETDRGRWAKGLIAWLWMFREAGCRPRTISLKLSELAAALNSESKSTATEILDLLEEADVVHRSDRRQGVAGGLAVFVDKPSTVLQTALRAVNADGQRWLPFDPDDEPPDKNTDDAATPPTISINQPNVRLSRR